ncbi:hypothetical protein NQ152_13610 [Microbacterium sp. zg.B48]|uniref:hypothetical protein n=1 Tax=Microbacterium sp. zg.B48 TaxID=2969408 RepID=UPI00214C3521|nr:hypothetical protein [Microbacterium sp. zg.B48]MCR2764543.1 hypothetical protein [Microbacterium sp. zg.B48]
MSGTANEFENPGANHPDRRDQEGVQPDPAEQRSDAGVGGAVNQSDDAPRRQETQDEPVLAQNQASRQEKIDGLVAQTRVDLGGESDERYSEVLRQRLEDAGIEMTDEDRQRLARDANPSSGGGGV